MAKYKQFQRKDYGTWEVWQKSYTRRELESRRSQLAKATNSRIRRLESARSEISGERLIDARQFDITMQYLEDIGKRRFSESKNQKGRSDFDIKREITVLENFLAMQSSTVGGLRAVENKRVESFMAKGVPEEVATSKEFYDFLNSETFESLAYSMLDSEDIIDFYSRAYEDGVPVEKILLAFEQHNATPNSSYKDMVKRMNALVLKK